MELPVYRSLREAVAVGRLRVAPSAASIYPFVVDDDLPTGVGAMLDRDADGHCVFFDRDSRLCIVHRDIGEPVLPLTCRHFPRLSVQDPRGIFITLSHFCPTAASMLFRDDPVSIVEGPAAFPGADYDGLAVTADDLPPLLSPRTLMDLDGYSAWERHMVARCADVHMRPESVLATLVRDANLLRQWRPGTLTLSQAIAELPNAYVEAFPEETLARSLRSSAEVMTAVPEDLKPEADDVGLEDAMSSYVRSSLDDYRAPLNRYIAAKAFASWTAYQGRGVKTIVRGLEAAYDVALVEAARQCRDAARRLDADLLKEAFRRADFVLNHLAVGEDLAKVWSSVEA